MFNAKNQAMEKEALLTSIRGIIGNPDADGNYGETGISQRTLDTYLESILPTLGEEAGADVIKAHAEILKSIGGQIRHEKAEFVKNYKPPVAPPVEHGNKEILEALAKIQADNKALQERLDNQEKDREQKVLMAKVLDGMRAKNASDEYVLKNAMRGVELDKDKSVEQLVEDSLKLYDAEYKAARGDGAKPRQGNGGGGGTDSDLDDFFAEMKKKGKF